eukprot:1157840-Pelagomonas_calceolata.AAC.1
MQLLEPDFDAGYASTPPDAQAAILLRLQLQYPPSWSLYQCLHHGWDHPPPSHSGDLSKHRFMAEDKFVRLPWDLTSSQHACWSLCAYTLHPCFKKNEAVGSQILSQCVSYIIIDAQYRSVIQKPPLASTRLTSSRPDAILIVPMKRVPRTNFQYLLRSTGGRRGNREQ